MNRRTTRRAMWLVPVTLIVSLGFALVVAAAADVTDDTIANFSGGTLGTCLASPSAGDAGVDGEVVLGLGAGAGGMLETFSGASLPAGWTSGPYGGGASLTVGGNVLTLDGYYAGQTTSVAPPRTLDFVATFNGPHQHVGLASDISLNSGAWAMFSTDVSADTLYMWTSDGVIANATLESLGTGYFGTAHRFRIEWTATSVAYYVDGTLFATHVAPTISGNMGLVASDATVDSTSLVVDWMRMGDYNPTCMFESRVLDGGEANIDWTTLETASYLPAGTTLSYETRSGNTLIPDVNWSPYQAVTGGAIASPNSQFIQYRVTLSTSDVRFTPEVRRVQVHGTTPTAVTLTALDARAHGLSSVPLFALAAVASLIVAGAFFKRRRQ